jgi:hypothetical protein
MMGNNKQSGRLHLIQAKKPDDKQEDYHPTHWKQMIFQKQ